MKKIFIIALIFLLGSCPNFLQSQTNFDQIEIVPTESEVSISPAELQTLLGELMQFKRRRLQQLATQKRTTGNDAVALQEALNDQNAKEKIAAIEKTLTQINERLTYLQQTKPTNNDAASAADLVALKTELAKELSEINAAIRVIANNPTTPSLPPAAVVNDSTYRLAMKDYFLAYAKQMTDVRAAFDSLQIQMSDLSRKNDLDSLYQALAFLESKIQTPIIVKVANDSTAISQNIEPTAYWEKQFAEMRQLLNELKETKQTTNPVPNNPERNEDLAEEVKAMHQMMEDLKTNLATPVPSIETAPVSPNISAELADIRKMILELQGKEKETIIKERTITEPFPIDTTYNWLRGIISDKEKRELLFENNSYQLKKEHLPIMDDAAFLMKNYGAIDVMVTGFTSEKGSPIYNQTLSQNRAEAVKKYLMTKGIHPSRIFTEYHGIDYDKKDATEGRRVEVVMMIRR